MKEDMSNIGNLFVFSQQPVVCCDAQQVVSANSAATSLFGKQLIGMQESAFLSDFLPDISTEAYITSAIIQNKAVTVSKTTYNEFHIYSFILEKNEQDAPAFQAVFATMRELTNNICMATSILGNAKNAAQDAKQNQYNAILRHNVAKMKRLVSNYTLLTAFQQNIQPFSPKMTDLLQLTKSLCERAGGYAHDAGITLSLHSSGNLVCAVDAPLYTQMLLNLLTNSLIHCDKGCKIQVNCKASRKAVTITVEDSGRGIPPEQLATVFNSRLTPVNLTGNGFTAGIGLSVANSVAQLHGGSLLIESHEGKGTKVMVQFPKVISKTLETAKTEYYTPLNDEVLTELSSWLSWESYTAEALREFQDE